MYKNDKSTVKTEKIKSYFKLVLNAKSFTSVAQMERVDLQAYV